MTVIVRKAVRRLVMRFVGRYCLFCERDYRFLPFGIDVPVFREKKIVGGGRRKAVQCPVCKSIDRERLVALYLRECTGVLSTRSKILHVAPEANLRRLLSSCAGIEYVAGDKFEPGYSYPESTVRLDVMRMPFADGEFDCVICNHVLEHVNDDRKAMAEIFRVLRPGGFAILQVPVASALERTFEDTALQTPEERLEAYGQADHVRLYGRDYPDRLRAAGFDVEAVRIARSGAFFRRNAINAREPVYKAVKPS